MRMCKTVVPDRMTGPVRIILGQFQGPKSAIPLSFYGVFNRMNTSRLERESGFNFSTRYLKDLATNGEWDNVEKYLSGFTEVDDNRYSMKIFFEIRKQKYLEALDKKVESFWTIDGRDRAKAVEILVKDLKVFAAFQEDLFKEITQLLMLENFRENEQLSKYGDTKSARSIMLAELKKLIEANPLFRDKLQFPTLKNSRLCTLINQRLFVDHTCGQPNGAHAPSLITNPLMGAIPKPGPFPPLTAHAVSILKRPRTPPTNNSAMDYQTADSEHVLKRSRPFAISDEVNNLPVNILPITCNNLSHGQSSYPSNDLPKNLVMTLNQGSPVKSMDFHLVQQILLLTGADMGDVMVWEVGSHARIALRNFKVWDLGTCSVTLQASLANDYIAPVNCVMWSPDGTLFCVAYSKHMVHIYSYHGGDDIRNQLEIEAHVGSVNDLAFSYPNEQLCVVTCGEDRSIKVWDAVTGTKQHSFEGHEAPVYSISYTYHGLGKRFGGFVQFDTTKNRFLAAGEEFVVKFWDMDNNNILTSTDAEGGLPPSDNSIKILANADGIRLLRTVENHTFDALGVTPGPLVKPPIAAFGSGNATVAASLGDRGAPEAAKVGMPPDNLTAMRVSRFIYTNLGLAILASSSIAVRKLWKWQKSVQNLTGKATASVLPQLWQPPSGILMTNDISDTNPEDAVPCFALSKNDSYVMSASVGKISLFNMMTFKTVTTFMPLPPAATFLAFHPQDSNIVAIGMEDFSIQIYNVRVDEPKGHQKRITGLAFRNVLNVLLSSGTDSQLCVWSTDGWEKQASKVLQMPTGRGAVPPSDIRVQFHLDQIHLLVVHETQIWVTQEASGPITHASYSCNGQYMSFEGGSIGGLRDGSVYVLEPSESEGKWGTSPPVENGAGPSTTSGATAPEQPQR
ncbi:hypothetical protein EUGRSUZ_C01361 [Eucalyptus grandis]|uniref:Uncharacterized protein n=2 Tax=Eucalyptus grandis TaxID=71139 RepID=A0ACC3LD72_EUCGR|nr:hypothetical protein EUGRSUZ_C01361 [Eucalyptus grandis]